MASHGSADAPAEHARGDFPGSKRIVITQLKTTVIDAPAQYCDTDSNTLSV
jgi:hypothetical protein